MPVPRRFPRIPEGFCIRFGRFPKNPGKVWEPRTGLLTYIILPDSDPSFVSWFPCVFPLYGGVGGARSGEPSRIPGNRQGTGEPARRLGSDRCGFRADGIRNTPCKTCKTTVPRFGFCNTDKLTAQLNAYTAKAPRQQSEATLGRHGIVRRTAANLGSKPRAFTDLCCEKIFGSRPTFRGHQERGIQDHAER